MSTEDEKMDQKPMKFRRRPLGVTAAWYMGGEGSGLEVAQWVRRNNGTATFFAHVPAWTSESGSEGYPAQSERIAMETIDGFAYAEPGSWIAKDSNGQFHIYGAETFERDFIQTSFPNGGSMWTQPIKAWGENYAPEGMSQRLGFDLDKDL